MLGRFLLGLALLMWAGAAQAQTGSGGGFVLPRVDPAQEQRYALVIGNEDYPATVGRLQNPHEDAAKIRDALIAAGFPAANIEYLRDATQSDINLAVARLSSNLKRAGRNGVGFFYYSGHGGSAEASGVRQNYLIPAKTPLTGAEQLPVLGVSMSGVIDSLSAAQAGAVFVVSDACRDTLPWTSEKGGASDKGMVPVATRSGMFIAYATADGATAPDDGAFASALAAHLPKAGLTASRAFELAFREVAQRRAGNRLPFYSPGLLDDVCFVSCPGESQPPEPLPGPADQQAFLGLMTGSRTLEKCRDYEQFLVSYPASQFVQQVEDLLQLPPCKPAPIATPAPRPTPTPTPTPSVRVSGWTAGQTFKDCEECPEMVVIPGGSFTMGSPSSESGRLDHEGPQRTVRIGGFAAGKYEVTRGQFAAFVLATGYDAGSRCRTYEGGSWDWRDGKNWLDPGFSQSDSHPVTCVDWSAAKAYVDWLNSKVSGSPYRLLTEAEWEYAVRAGSSSRYHFGDDQEGLCQYANGADATGKAAFNWGAGPTACKDGYAATAPVGSYQANAFGLYDMHGNVWEWVEDCYQDSYAGAPTDGSAVTTGACSYRVYRGGSWGNAPEFLRSAYRFGRNPGARGDGLGFRLAKDAP